MSAPTTLLPFQPATMSSAQLAAVSYLARYSGHTHGLYAYQLRQWFAWCESNGLDPLAGIQRAHVELYVRQLGDQGLMDSSVVTMMHAVRGYFRFAHIDGLIPSDPAVYARLPKVHLDEQGSVGPTRHRERRVVHFAPSISVKRQSSSESISFDSDSSIIPSSRFFSAMAARSFFALRPLKYL